MARDPDLLRKGLDAVAAVSKLVARAECLPTTDDGVLLLDQLDVGEDILPGETDRQLRKDLLAVVGTIEVTRGYGGPARLSSDRADVAPAALGVAKKIWEALCATPDGYLSPDALKKVERSDDAIERANLLLKTLRLVTGRRRAGGIQLAVAAEAAIQEAAKREEDLGRRVEADKEQAREHESVLYDAAADLLERAYGGQGVRPIVLGNRQLADGQWNTPDVVGFYVKPAGAGGLPILRVFSVEVKWRLSRDAIAEAASHKRFANYAFIFVPTSYSDLDVELVTECTQAGVGLMCPRQANSQTFYVQIEPPLHRPDEEWVDWFLSAFKADDGLPLGQVVAKEVRRALAAVIAGA